MITEKQTKMKYINGFMYQKVSNYFPIVKFLRMNSFLWARIVFTWRKVFPFNAILVISSVTEAGRNAL